MDTNNNIKKAYPAYLTELTFIAFSSILIQFTMMLVLLCSYKVMWIDLAGKQVSISQPLWDQKNQFSVCTGTKSPAHIDKFLWKMLTRQNQHFLTTKPTFANNRSFKKIPNSLLRGRKQTKLTGMATVAWGKSCEHGTPEKGLRACDLDLGKKWGKERPFRKKWRNLSLSRIHTDWWHHTCLAQEDGRDKNLKDTDQQLSSFW